MKKTNNKRIAIGIGIVLIMFAVSSAEAYPIPPGKDAVVYFDPDPSSGPNGEDVTVQLRVNSSVGLCGYADWIYFDPSCVDITDVDYSGSPFSEGTSWISFGDFIKVHGMDPSYCEPAGDHLLCTLTLQCKSDGVCTSQLIHNMDHEEIYDCDLEVPDTLWVDGNFTCQCGGTCYANADCTGDATENVTCKDCIGVAGLSWSNYEFESPCSPGIMVPRRNYTYCPECCDGIDNDADGSIDWPADEECKCCLDETENFKEGCPAPCVPELATVTFVSVGLLGLIGAIWRRRYD